MGARVRVTTAGSQVGEGGGKVVGGSAKEIVREKP
jgi:hypothetical protein